ncbi:hypothetical protein QCA50_017328 [Cerrena zonata]|uniref:Protein kinase domain-containing protein n=1 Tax=Cerrena zonata TaxID=2478898 RepID=A0AAW0FQR8_9APHY
MINLSVFRSLPELPDILSNGLHNVVVRLTGWLLGSTTSSSTLSILTTGDVAAEEPRAKRTVQQSCGSVATAVGLPLPLLRPLSLLYATPGILSYSMLNTTIYTGLLPLLSLSNDAFYHSSHISTPHDSNKSYGIQSFSAEIARRFWRQQALVHLNHVDIVHNILTGLPSGVATLQALRRTTEHERRSLLAPSRFDSPGSSELELSLALPSSTNSAIGPKPDYDVQASRPYKEIKTSYQWIRDLPDPRFQKCLFRKTLLSRTVDLIVSLEHLWTKSIHPIIKPENISLNDKGHLTVSSTQPALQLGIASRDETRDQITDAYYAAPEMSCNRTYTRRSEIWSLGVVLFEMHAKLDAPYFSTSMEVEDDVTHAVQHKSIEFGLIHCQVARSLIRNLLVRDPNKRYSFRQVKAHPYFRSVNWSRELARRCIADSKQISNTNQFPCSYVQ